MYDLFGYIKKYGDVSFCEKEFNVIDSMILSAINYIDFRNIVGKDKVNLGFALRSMLGVYSFKDYVRTMFLEKDVIKLAKVLVNQKRYSDINIYNYVYKLTSVEQFGALTYKLDDGSVYVSFLGTDDTIVGWNEDFNMIHQFPVPAQKDAIKYLNKTVSIFDRNVYVGGHSKGGNLALVSSMYANMFIRRKIRKIYSLDGPGLKRKYINSKKYKKVESKYVHVIPNYSVIGLLLRHNDNHTVVKSSTMTVKSHSMFTWLINDDKLNVVNLSKVSRRLGDSITLWLNEHNDVTRKDMVEKVFNTFKISGITKVSGFLSFKKLYSLIKNVKGLDVGTKKLLIDFFKFNLGYIIDNKKD